MNDKDFLYKNYTVPKEMWKTQVEKESKSNGLEKEAAVNRARWSVGVGEIEFRLG